MCSKQAGGCFLVCYATFNLFGYFCNTKNVCSKQAEGCFLIYLGTCLMQKCVFKTSGRLLFNLFGYFSNMEKCVFKTSGRLLFNLFGYFSNTKNVCSKQVRGCFFIYLATFLIQKMCAQNKREAAFQFIWVLF